MVTFTRELNIKQIESAIKRLKPKQKIRLIERLEKETWAERFESLLARIDRKSARHPISEEEITAACDEVRHNKRHARGRH